MAYHDSEVCTVSWDRSLDAVGVEWKDFASGDAYRSALDAAIDCLRDHDAERMYGNALELGTIPQEDQEWTAADWAPRAESAGLESLAVIYPETVVAQMSVDSVLEEFNDDIRRNIFDDPAPAKEWLDAQ